MNRSVSYEWTLRAAKNLPGFVSYNGSLTPKDGKTKEEIEAAEPWQIADTVEELKGILLRAAGLI